MELVETLPSQGLLVSSELLPKPVVPVILLAEELSKSDCALGLAGSSTSAVAVADVGPELAQVHQHRHCLEKGPSCRKRLLLRDQIRFGNGHTKLPPNTLIEAGHVIQQLADEVEQALLQDV